MHRTNGDLRNNLLEAVHKRRSQLRHMWHRGEISYQDWQVAKTRLDHWFNYRLTKLTHA